MARTRIVVAVLLGVVAAGFAGAQDNKERKFEIGFKGKDGKLTPYYQQVETKVTQVIKVQNQDLTQKQSSKFWYQWTPVKEEKATEGKDTFTRWTVKQKIEGLEMNIDISGNPISYSSKTEATGSSGNPGLVEFFKGLKDTEFTVTLGKNYKVEKVEGKDEFIKKIGAGSQQMDALLKKVLTEDALKEMVDPTAKLFPPDGAPKKVGDTWENKTTLKLGPIGTYDLTYKVKYAAVEKEKDKLEVETVIKYTAPKENPDALLFRIKDGSTLESVPAGSKGTVIYDPKTQRIESAEINVKLDGKLTVVIGGTDTKVELDQQQTTTITTSDTSYVTPKAPTTPPMPEKK